MGNNMDVKTRLEGEKRVVRALIEHLNKAGFEAYKVNDGGEEDVDCRTGSPDEIVELTFNTDDSRIWVRKKAPEGSMIVARGHWIYIVLGNSPEEVINDYSFSPGDPDGFDAAMEAFHPEEIMLP